MHHKAHLIPILLAHACLAQTPTFEVASVKLSTSTDRRSTFIRGGPGTDTPGYWYASGISLSGLILKAFAPKSYAFSYPEWMDTARYDVTAKIPDGASKQDLRAMIEQLLRERFNISVHARWR
jgi:uncharacterized protein (TIGR03435 family)